MQCFAVSEYEVYSHHILTFWVRLIWECSSLCRVSDPLREMERQWFCWWLGYGIYSVTHLNWLKQSRSAPASKSFAWESSAWRVPPPFFQDYDSIIYVFYVYVKRGIIATAAQRLDLTVSLCGCFCVCTTNILRNCASRPVRYRSASGAACGLHQRRGSAFFFVDTLSKQEYT